MCYTFLWALVTSLLCRFVDSAQWWVNGDNWESSVLFFVMFYQYITCALAYSLGSTFRLSLLYNWAVVVCPVASALLVQWGYCKGLLHVPTYQCSTDPVWASAQGS